MTELKAKLSEEEEEVDRKLLEANQRREELLCGPFAYVNVDRIKTLPMCDSSSFYFFRNGPLFVNYEVFSSQSNFLLQPSLSPTHSLTLTQEHIEEILILYFSNLEKMKRSQSDQEMDRSMGSSQKADASK